MIRLLILLIILLFNSPVFGGGVVFDAGGVEAGGSPATTYGATATGANGRYVGGVDAIAYARAGLLVTTGGDVAKIGGYFTSGSGLDRTVQLGLYSDDGGDGKGPYLLQGTQVALTVPTGSTDAQIEVDYSATISSGTYHIGYIQNHSDVGATYDSGVSGDRPRVTLTVSNTLAADWTAESQLSDGDILLSLYVVVE